MKSSSVTGSDDRTFPIDSKNPDTLPDPASDAAAQLAALSPAEYAAMEKKLVRKMDTRMVPWLT
jgi:hypothetical protein